MHKYLRFQPITADVISYNHRYKGGVSKVYDFILGVLSIKRTYLSGARVVAEPTEPGHVHEYAPGSGQPGA